MGMSSAVTTDYLCPGAYLISRPVRQFPDRKFSASIVIPCRNERGQHRKCDPADAAICFASGDHLCWTVLRILLITVVPERIGAIIG
jgi:hypothetical protein